MAKKHGSSKAAASSRQGKGGRPGTESSDLEGMVWRVDRLERQVRRLSELVREHAVDADRLVQIVAEDREILQRELLGNGSQPVPPDRPVRF